MVESYSTKLKGIHTRGALKSREHHRPGADIVQEDMEQLNKRYHDLVARVNLRVDTINAAGNVGNVRTFVSLQVPVVYFVRKFCTEIMINNIHAQIFRFSFWILQVVSYLAFEHFCSFAFCAQDNFACIFSLSQNFFPKIHLFFPLQIS